MRESRHSGRHSIRLLAAVSLGTTPLIPLPSKAELPQVRAGKAENGPAVRQHLLKAACTQVQALDSISKP